MFGFIKKPFQYCYAKLKILVGKFYSGGPNPLEKTLQKLNRKRKAIAVGILLPIAHYQIGFGQFAHHFLAFVSARLYPLIAIFTISGLMANTHFFLQESLDNKLERLWQTHIQSIPGVEKFVRLCKRFGEYGFHFVTVCLLTMIIEERFHKGSSDPLYTSTEQALNNYLSCVLIQAVSSGILGAGRPVNTPTSTWKILDRNQKYRFRDGRTISGHAATSVYLGASMGLLAEEICEKLAVIMPPPAQPFIQGTGKLLRFSAMVPAIGCTLERVQHRAHYPSQAMGGALLGLTSAMKC